MTSHKTGTREEWLAARLELLEAEKKLTRHGDELSRRRQELPWVRVDKDYRFETDKGTASLTNLFGGRSQLLVYHFMFGPGYTAGCPACSAIADGFSAFAIHLAHHDVMLWAVSRAPLASCRATGSGWAGASSGPRRPGATSTPTSTSASPRAGACGRLRVQLPRVARVVAAAGRARAVRRVGRHDGHRLGDLHAGAAGHERVRARGRSRLYTYSAYARGLNGLWGMYQWLDRAPRGRNEARGPDDPLNWFRRHDEYQHTNRTST